MDSNSHFYPLRRRQNRAPVRTGSGASRQRAFTLLELMVVILIMVLLGAGAGTVFRSPTDVNKAAWDLSGLLEKARAYAMAQNTYVWVCFNDQSGQASTSTQTNTLVFVVGSQDGTANTTKTGVANYKIIGNAIRLDSLKIVDLSAANTGGYANKAPISNTADTGYEFAPLRTTALTGGGISVKTNGVTCSTNKIIQIDPEGTVKLPLNGNMISQSNLTLVKWIEIGIQRYRGTSPGDPANTAILQIAGLTGQVRIFRP